jgi:hypothetical protein
MVQVASLFNQLLHHFPRLEFGALVKKHKAERAAKGFDCWTQFVSMLFCQLGHADSLREICNGLSCCLGKRVHLGISRAPSKSTLSYANEHRPAALYQELFYTALSRFRAQQGLGVRKRTFRFKNKLLSLDSTTLSLCLSLFPWAKFRRAKGGVKAHVLLDHDDYLPRYVLLTPARASDVRLAMVLIYRPARSSPWIGATTIFDSLPAGSPGAFTLSPALCITSPTKSSSHGPCRKTATSFATQSYGLPASWHGKPSSTGCAASWSGTRTSSERSCW